MRSEQLREMSTTELVELRSEIELLLAERSLGSKKGSSREVLEEREVSQGTLRCEIRIHEDGSVHGPYWYLYYYADTKAGKRKLMSENLGRELPEEYL